MSRIWDESIKNGVLKFLWKIEDIERLYYILNSNWVM